MSDFVADRPKKKHVMANAVVDDIDHGNGHVHDHDMTMIMMGMEMMIEYRCRRFCG